MPETHIELADLTFRNLFTNHLDVFFIPVFVNFMIMRKIKRHLRDGRKTKSVKQKSTCPM